MLLMAKDGVGSAPVTGADENVNSSSITYQDCDKDTCLPLFIFTL